MKRVLCVAELAIIVPCLPPYGVQTTYGAEVGFVPLETMSFWCSADENFCGSEDMR